MKKSNPFFRFLILSALSAFLLLPALGFSFQAGFLAGGGFESWEKSSEISPEISGFCGKIEALASFKAGNRIRFFPGIGLQFSQDLNSIQVGSRITWIIHPHYSPFIGGSAYYRYYKSLGSEKNLSVFWAGFTAGFRFITLENSSFWLFMDYGFFQSKFEDYTAGDFTLSLAWLVDL